MTSKAIVTLVPIPQPQYMVEIALSLTREDAAFLLALTDRVGGHPDKTTRGVFDQIRAGLLNAGIVQKNNAFENDTDGSRGNRRVAVYFNPRKED